MAIGYRCEGCGVVRAETWRGMCPACYSYNNIRRTVASEGVEEGPPPRGQIVNLNAVSAACLERVSTGFAGIDRILGTDPVTGVSGIAAKGGQAIQVYGVPGSGKSTLLLQVCRELTKQRYTVLYVAGEESLQQIKSRADRLGRFNSKMIAIEEQDLDEILYSFEEANPTVAVIDSIQTISVEDYSPGSLAGMRIAAREIYKFTQSRGIGLFFVVQVNKTGDDFAGPKEIEHIVDTSLFLRVDKNGLRKLDCNTKNRFGLTPASQAFRMTDKGLVEVADEDEPEPSRLIMTP